MTRPKRRKFKLVGNREKWAESHKGVNLNGLPLKLPVSTGLKQAAALQKLVGKMNSDLKKRLTKVFKNNRGYFATDASITHQLKMVLADGAGFWEAEFTKRADSIVKRLISDVDTLSGKSIQNSLKELSGGLKLSNTFYTGRIREMLSASTLEAVNLIVSIPTQYFKQVETPITQLITNPKSNGLEGALDSISKICEKYGKQTANRAKLLTLDQTRKAYANLNRQRLQAMGITKFKWLHMGGSVEPRQLHKRLSGQVFDFNNPPIIDERTGERGYPATAINCRCQMIPIYETNAQNEMF